VLFTLCFWKELSINDKSRRSTPFAPNHNTGTLLLCGLLISTLAWLRYPGGMRRWWFRLDVCMQHLFRKRTQMSSKNVPKEREQVLTQPARATHNPAVHS
ncbi:unnamed protein product, partial [Ectocarpus sp. 12 AP-2014]